VRRREIGRKWGEKEEKKVGEGGRGKDGRDEDGQN
tara:strand:+ start:671 stop:775 length:105 start_codon:yes stop_codon:yes gene_type:complete